MKELIYKLWTWYGRRQGWLDVSAGTYVLSWEGAYPTYYWRGAVLPDIRTLVVRPGLSLTAWNRELSNAEIAEFVRISSKVLPPSCPTRVETGPHRFGIC